MKFTILLFIVSSILLLVSDVSSAQDIERKNVPEKYKWNLSDMFMSISDWQKTKNEIISNLDDITKYKGRLGESAEIFYTALKNYFDIQKKYYRLSDYASRLGDEDLRNSENQALVQESTRLGTSISEKTSFISPEIITIDSSKIKQFFAEKKELNEFKMFVYDIERLKAHTLNTEEEKIMASAGNITSTPNEVYSIFDNAEMPFAEITLPDEGKIKLTPSAFTKYRTSESRENRKEVFEAFFNKYSQFKNTLGANMSGKINGDYFYAKNRNYNTTLEYALNGPNIPTSVYTTLVDQIHKNLSTLKRFLQLKKKMLGVDTLHYYDLYTPIVKKVDMKFSIDEGENIILDALKPLGEDYISVLKKAFANRWIDFYPTVGKASGAYESGASYEVHPYLLINWNDNYESLTTLAHELGHAMHSYYSNKNQTFANSQYPIFVAEIASTLNENLLNNYMVQHAKSNEEKIYLLGHYLELLRTTIFRQTQFAEFELEMHKLAETDKPITGENLSTLYYNLVKEYYGNDASSCIVDPYIAYEWEYIPHFLAYTYYVYQYSTSLIYSTAIAEKILKNGQPAVDKYFNILKGGSSEYPIQLIKEAGIDPLSSEAFNLTMEKMNKVMDQIETLLPKK